MLVKYKTSVINLDNVSEFVLMGQKTIKFFFDSFDHDSQETTSSYFEFDSEDHRDFSFHEIIRNYEDQERVLLLH